MAQWFLLALTLASAFLTFDAFRLDNPRTEVPYSILPRSWKRGLDHLPLAEQDRLQTRLRPVAGVLGLGVLSWLFLAITILLAVLTVMAFLK